MKTVIKKYYYLCLALKGIKSGGYKSTIRMAMGQLTSKSLIYIRIALLCLQVMLRRYWQDGPYCFYTSSNKFKVQLHIVYSDVHHMEQI